MEKETTENPCRFSRRELSLSDDCLLWLSRAKFFVFDYDDTITRYIPREHILHVSHVALISLQNRLQTKTREDLLELDAYYRIDRRSIGWKEYINEVRRVSKEIFDEENQLFFLAALFARSVDSEATRTKIAENLSGDRKAGSFWKTYRELFTKTQRPFFDYLQIPEGLPELIKLLFSRGSRFFVVSNSTSNLVLPGIAHVERAIGSDCLFEQIICLKDDPDIPLKPNPQALILLMKKIGAFREETIYVGNTIEDVEFAQAVGINSVIIGNIKDDFGPHISNVSHCELNSFMDLYLLLSFL